MGRDDFDAQLPTRPPKLGEYFFPTISRLFFGLFINYVDILLIRVQANTVALNAAVLDRFDGRPRP
jgi:hypothetical protein